MISALSIGLQGAKYGRLGANALNRQNCSSGEVCNCKTVRGHVKPKADPAGQAVWTGACGLGSQFEWTSLSHHVGTYLKGLTADPGKWA